MSRSRRSDTISLAFGTAGLAGGSSAGLVVADLKAASAMSRLLPPDRRVLSLDIFGLCCEVDVAGNVGHHRPRGNIRLSEDRCAILDLVPGCGITPARADEAARPEA